MKAVLCPRCRSEVDVAAFAPGSTVRCSDCGGMLRVPTGKTALNVPAVQPPVVEDRKSTKVRTPSEGRAVTRTRMRLGGGSETRIRRLPARSSNNGLLVGLLIGAVLVIVGLVFVLASGRKTPPSPAVAQSPPSAPSMPVPGLMPVPAVAPVPVPVPVTAPEADSSGPSFRGGDPAKQNWDQIMQMLRPGGGFDDPGRPEGAAFMKVKAMGKEAYPYIIRYIDHQDVMLGRAAVTVLNELTGRNAPGKPTDATKVQIKTEWETWLKANP